MMDYYDENKMALDIGINGTTSFFRDNRGNYYWYPESNREYYYYGDPLEITSCQPYSTMSDQDKAYLSELERLDTETIHPIEFVTENEQGFVLFCLEGVPSRFYKILYQEYAPLLEGNYDIATLFSGNNNTIDTPVLIEFQEDILVLKEV